MPPKPSATQLDWISWAPPFDQLLSYQELQQLIPDFAPAVCADDINVQLAACLAGAGVMLLPQVLLPLGRSLMMVSFLLTLLPLLLPQPLPLLARRYVSRCLRVSFKHHRTPVMRRKIAYLT